MWQQIVRDWLEENERSQAWLARKAGLDTTWVYLILSGRRHPGPKTLRKLEAAMGKESGTLSQRPLALSATGTDDTGADRATA